jgi:hypothetical protein
MLTRPVIGVRRVDRVTQLPVLRAREVDLSLRRRGDRIQLHDHDFRTVTR